MKRLKLRKEVKFITCLLCFALLLGFLPTMNVIAEDPSQQPHSVTVSQDNDILYTNKYVELSASYEGTEEANYQWQIYLANADTWVNIADAKDSVLKVTYAMVANAVANDSAQLRCNVIDGDSSTVSESVVLNIAEPVVNEVEEITSDEPVTEEPLATSGYSLNRVSRNTSNYDLSPNTAETNIDTCTITVLFKYYNGSTAYEPTGGTIKKGENFKLSVSVPKIQGYNAYSDKNTIDEYLVGDEFTIDLPNVVSNYTYTIWYFPAPVKYSVKYWQQNVNDDNYTCVETIEVDPSSENPDITKYIKCTNDTIPDNLTEIVSFDGFYSLLYDKSLTVAADGSTVVDIYYDRYYYLMNFDLDGGYGVEPVYARFGYPIEDVGTPTKSGYRFEGWTDKEGNLQESLPNTMPAENKTFVAKWTPNDTATLTVVFWGENADDEKYSYLSSKQIKVKPETEFTYSEDDTLICALEEHKHSIDECYELTCTQEVHTHSDSCYKCDIENHTHNTSCYAGVGSTSSAGIGAPKNPPKGYVHREAWSIDGKVIYINGTWYKYNGNTESGNIAPTTCGKDERTHEHTNDCLGCGKTAHTHSINNDCYTLSCGKTEHSHTSDCYMSGAGLNPNLWTFVRSDTVTVAADGTSVVNVYYDRTSFTLTFKANNSTVSTIKEKWGAAISDKFLEAPFSTTYNGRAWECTDENKYSYALQTLDRMPQFNATFNLYKKSSDTLKTINYYVENVDANVSENSWPNNPTNFTLLKKVDTYFNFATYNEEYHEILGYTRYSSSTAGFNKNNRKDFSNNSMSLYYLRNDYNLVLNNGLTNINTLSVQYQKNLGEVTLNDIKLTSYVPVAPDGLYEPGSVVFGGWYLNPECTGEEYKLNEHTMPANDLLLYAKWIPVTRTVKFYEDKNALTEGTEYCNSISVLHGSKLYPIPEDPTLSIMTFVGWFYEENGIEKAFDFDNMPITKDMSVYGKWTANTMIQYRIQFGIIENDKFIPIADDLIGSALAGTDKTFYAKTGNELKDGYQRGYFPETSSHTISNIGFDLISTDEEVIYQFIYIPVSYVKYEVHYVDKDTSEELKPYKSETTYDGIVTEIYEEIDGYVPDAYQKTLILSSKEELNRIYFYYERDNTRAPVIVRYLYEDSDGNGYTERSYFQTIEKIDNTYTATIPVDNNFVFEKATVNGVEVKPTTLEGKDVISTRVVKPKVEIIVYYKRKVADLVINKTVVGTVDKNQDFVFKVENNSNPTAKPFIVVIHGEDILKNNGTGSVTIASLPVNNRYTITELTDWSWRYSVLGQNSVTVKIEENASGSENVNIVQFTNQVSNDKWLSSDNKKENQFAFKPTE